MLNYLDSDSEEEYDDILGQIFFNKYYCIRKLGEGSFGQIYEAEYKNEKYALKFENRIKNYNLLQNEAAIINYLKGPNIPFVKSYGFTSNYNILVMQLLGKSLENLLNFYNFHLSLFYITNPLAYYNQVFHHILNFLHIPKKFQILWESL